MTEKWWVELGICILLVMVVAGIYGRTLNHEFINYDDSIYVYSNPLVTGGLTVEGAKQAFTQKELGLWNPLVTISHMMDWQFYGSWAGGHHLTNLLLHLVSVLLLFLILHRMTGALWCSACVAILFAAHPLRVESVAWVAERKDVLSGFFFMLVLGSYLYYVKNSYSLLRYGMLVLCFGLGLMAKPMLITLPFLLLLFDYWPLQRLFVAPRSRNDPGRRIEMNWPVVREKIPLIVFSFAVGLLTLSGTQPPTTVDPIPFLDRLALAPVWVTVYLRQMFWPAGLAVIYPCPQENLLWWPAALGMCMAVSWIFFLLRRKRPYLLMGWLWNLGMLVPVLGVIQISRHSQADHYNYLPQIGLYLAFVWLIAAWVGKRKRLFPVAIAGALILLGTLAVLSYRQALLWRDNVTLWKYTIAVTENNAVAHDNLGTALREMHQVDAAFAEYRKAVLIDPEDAAAHNNLGKYFFETGREAEAVSEFRQALATEPANAEIHVHLGMALAKQGQVDGAIDEYQVALHLDPDYPMAHFKLGNALHQRNRNDEAVPHLREALRLDSFWAEAHNDLGTIYYEQGKLEDAASEYRTALKIDPEYAQAHSNLAFLFMKKTQMEEAEAEWRESLRINPSDLSVLSNLGQCLLTQGKKQEALLIFEKTIQIQPENPVFQNNLAWTLLQVDGQSVRNCKRAIGLAQQADQIAGSQVPLFARTLAAAYASAGDFSKAREIAEKALQLARKQGQERLESDLVRDIGFYRGRQPLFKNS